jgi:hypothetical protein
VKRPVGVPFLPLVLALCAAPAVARAASPPSVQWVADVTPDPSTSYPVNSVHRLADGSVLVLESMFFAGVTASHLDAAGAVLSTQELPLPDIYDGSLRMTVDSSGAVYVGLTAVPSPLLAWVMKFDGLTGRALWPGPFHYRPDPFASTLFRSGLALDAHGDLFVSGGGASGGSGTQVWTPFLFKLDGATGGILWGPVSFADPSTPNVTFSQVCIDAKGDAVVSGGWGDSTGTVGQLEAFKFDGRTGALLWGPVLVPSGTTGPDTPYYAALDPGGDLVIAGQRADGTLYRPLVVKIAGADGSVLWGPRIPDGTGTRFAAVNLLRLDARGDVLLGAWLPGGSGNTPTLLKLSGQDGSAAWGPIPYPGDATAYVYLLDSILEANGDLVTTFAERNGSPSTSAASTVRIDGATGALRWGPVALPTVEGSAGLLLDPTGNLLLAATTYTNNAFSLVYTSRVVFYLGSTGETIRGPLDLPAGARSARAAKVAVDANGDVVTLGQLNRDGSDWAVLVKYRGAKGAVVWGPIEMPVDTWGLPVDLKLAANGDPIWIGTRQSVYGTGGIAVSRFSASTGAVVWGPAVFGRAYAEALALDGNGDVFALGDSVILKSDGLTGALLWGPLVVPNAYVNGLRVGPTGDVTVAGWYSGVSTLTQYHGSTGALAWGPVPVAAASSPQAMGIDASGDILLAGSGSVMKLRGLDASIAWGPVPFVDPLGGPGYSATLALDAEGNAVVGDFIFDGPTLRRSAIFAKYANSSGAALWGPVTWDASDGPAPLDGHLAVDSSGDVVAAANGLNDDYQDMMVRKYSGADGSPVWGPVTFDGPGTNYLMDLALAGNDPVLAASSFGSMRTVRFGFGLSLETQAWQVPPALCGQAYRFAFQVRNGVPPYAFSITNGALPAGLLLDAGSGVLSGAAGPPGAYSFRLRVGSGAGSVERDFTMVVVEGQPVVDIQATAAAVCPGSSAVLSVSGAYASYLWLPGGETTPTVTVSPASTTTYDFVGTTTGGCIQRGSRVLTVLPLPALPAISAPSVVLALAVNLLAAVADHPGSHYLWSIAGGAIVAGQGTHEIRFGAGVGGDVTLRVVETTGNGCMAPAASFTTQVTPASTRFFAVQPCRVYDSRTANLPFAAGEVRRLPLGGLCGLPPTARAVAMNVTAVGVSGGGSLSVAPGGIAPGAAASGPSWMNGQVRAASTIVGVDAAGAVDVSCQAVAGAAHLVIDVAGYFE